MGLMGNNVLTVYQDKDNEPQTEAAQHSPRSPHRDNAAFTAFQPADMGVNPLPLRTQSPEGERIMTQHTPQAHAEPGQPTLYPTLPTTDNSQPSEEEQRELGATVQQGVPAGAYGQQPNIDLDSTREAYVSAGPPIRLRTTEIAPRRRTKSEAASKFNNYSELPPPPQPSGRPQSTNNGQAERNPTTINAMDSPYSVQPPYNNPTIIGLRFTEVFNNTINIPQINQDSVSRSQVAEILVRNTESFDRDTAIEACTRQGCVAPAACYLQRRKEQADHLLLYHFLKCIQITQPKKNLLSLSRSRR